MIDLLAQFYKFKIDPFRLSSDYKFSFAHKTYKNALSYLKFALYSEEGFIVITGRPGTGKTTLINETISQLDPNKVEVATLVTTQYEAHDLLNMIASPFGLNADVNSKSSILLALEKFLRIKHSEGKRVLLIVDEAQGLKADAVEELRLLSNLQIDGKPLLQIFLIGQEEFRDIINSPKLEQLRQRIIASSHLEPLTEDETVEYIVHRLNHAGWVGDPRITKSAVLLIHHFSGGIPRIINLISGRLLLHGCMEERHELNSDDMKSVLEELVQESLVIDNDISLADAIEKVNSSKHEFIQPLIKGKETSAKDFKPQSLAKNEEIPHKNYDVQTSDAVVQLKVKHQQQPMELDQYIEETLAVLSGNTLEKISTTASGKEYHEHPEPANNNIEDNEDLFEATDSADSIDYRTDEGSNEDVANVDELSYAESRSKESVGLGGYGWIVALSIVFAVALLSPFYFFMNQEQSENISLKKDAVGKNDDTIAIINSLDFSVHEKKSAAKVQAGYGEYSGKLDTEIEQSSKTLQLNNITKPTKENTDSRSTKIEDASTTSPTDRLQRQIPVTNSRDTSRQVVSGVNKLTVLPRNDIKNASENVSRTIASQVISQRPINQTDVLAKNTTSELEAPATQLREPLVRLLQGVEGFGAEQQRKYLLEGRWGSDTDRVEFLPSEKVHCRDFVQYVSCWGVPEYSKTEKATYKHVVKSTISGFTDKGSFRVTSSIRKTLVETGVTALGQANTLNVPEYPTVIKIKRCVFIEHNYISCSNEQGGIERYKRTTL